MSLMSAAPSSLLTTGQPAGLEGGAGMHPVPGKRRLAKVTPWNLTRDLGAPEPLLRGTCSETWIWSDALSPDFSGPFQPLSVTCSQGAT